MERGATTVSIEARKVGDERLALAGFVLDPSSEDYRRKHAEETGRS